MTTAIIDDEPLAAELLATYTKKIPFLQLTGTYNSAIEAMKDLRQNPVELLFLDIQMPELSGLEFASILPPATKVVFTTAFDKYAVDSYKVNCIDYLLKPIAFEDFLRAADKANKLNFNASVPVNVPVPVTPDPSGGFIYVKSDYKLVRIFLSDILYVEGLKDYVKIHLSPDNRSGGSRNVLCLMNMKDLEDSLPSPEFQRIHRSYIVHMPMADAIERQRIIFGQNYLPISDSYKDAVQQYVNSHTI
ncbi:MAG: response regulator transcription factor [Prevotella sp.]|nr:response regulator transcription factor [Prevotella sp.]MBQ9560960.1 response regulator transcription factor [Prevotella sp.]